ncbi:tripartite tricarboxylate transporter permease [Psychromonas sp. SA13A]|uniref:tripartite tricarboxylate transporter permease n=1 Tax=Psychromonas sp. SA13A TaxID=2686346 RepID=UPI00140B2958|nr:tripartite tricarboxylate transporter permease [Psychromonas sp. SA13A]
MDNLFIEGFIAFFTVSSFVYLNLGLLLGLVFGSIPGLTVMLCLVLFMPFTYTMDAIASFMFLLGIYCSGSYGGSISAILIKTPGTPHAAATMLDGYPLARSGKPKKALLTALYASGFGGIFSALVLLFAAPLVAQIALNFGPPEYFILCVFGLLIISGVSSGNLLKGIIAGCLGLLLSTVGMDSISGVFRFTFDDFNLYGGLNLVIVLIGLFAISETISNASKYSKTVKYASIKTDDNKDDVLPLKEFFSSYITLIRSSVIGTVIGCIPGTGASMASFLSYDTARRNSKNKAAFGKGSEEGIAAAESANNAVTGATLIPLLTLGIPGDAAVAILLGTLMINGLTPGPNLFQEHGVEVYAVMIGLIVINIFMLIQGRLLMPFFAKITKVDFSLLTPLIVIFCFAGTFSINNTMYDIFVAIIFGVAAYILIKLDFSPIPILLGLVLGNLTEMNLRRTVTMAQGDWFFVLSRPASLALIAIFVSLLAWFAYSRFRQRSLQNKTEEQVA